MARPKGAQPQRDVRRFLLAEAVEERRRYGSTDLAVWRELSRPIEQLESGQVYVLRRFELPDDHPMRFGDPSALLVLGADDVLRVADQHGGRARSGGAGG
ncbi:hypothetical protein AB0L97_20230 [Nocardia sp. NPDC051911]|uniref:hypothetical protein n=1 Tax=Nocardia sp. NPDC051911 TaxID=3154648 RepID=UPI0034480D09